MIMQQLPDIRSGLGYDVHAFADGRALILCGVEISHTQGLLADALLGAAAMRDIGYHFPDTDPRFAGADSRKLLRHVVDLVAGEGYSISNADITIVAQAPKLAPHIEQMRANVASDLGVGVDRVSVKATTTALIMR